MKEKNKEIISHLQKMAKVINTDNILTRTEVKQVFSGVIGIISKYKQETQEINKSTNENLKEVLKYIQSEHHKVITEIEEENKNTKETILKKYEKDLKKINSQVAELLIEIKSKNPENGKDADEQKIIDIVVKELEGKLPKNTDLSELLETGESIISKINDAPLDNENKIDASRIKNLPVHKQVPAGARFINQLQDVALTDLSDDQILQYDSTSGTWKNVSLGAGTGDVVGPSSSTDNALVRFDSTTGKLIQNSTATLDDSGNLFTASVQPTAGVLAGTSGTTTTTASTAQLFGSTSSHYQLSTGGISFTATADFNFFSEIIRQATVTEAATGTHAIIGGLAVRAPIITSGLGSTTNAVTVYIDGAPSGTASPSNVYSLWVDAGTVRLDGTVTFGTSATPQANDGATLGTTALQWSDLFLASGGVINFANGNATLTHSTGLITSNVPFSLGTSNALTAGTIELGHASDTTISRSSAGVIAVEGVVVPTISSTNTLTNKFVTPQIQSVADAGGTLTPVSITNDMVIATALSQATTIAAPSGTPVQGESLIIRLKDNGTARALTWNSIYRAIGVTLPTTTVINKTVYCGFKYNSTDTKWDCIAVGQEA